MVDNKIVTAPRECHQGLYSVLPAIEFLHCCLFLPAWNATLLLHARAPGSPFISFVVASIAGSAYIFFSLESIGQFPNKGRWGQGQSVFPGQAGEVVMIGKPEAGDHGYATAACLCSPTVLHLSASWREMEVRYA